MYTERFEGNEMDSNWLGEKYFIRATLAPKYFKSTSLIINCEDPKLEQDCSFVYLSEMPLTDLLTDNMRSPDIYVW